MVADGFDNPNVVERPVVREQAESFDLGAFLLRASIGGLLLMHGIHKMQNGIEPIRQMFAERNWPIALAGLVYVGEVVAPIFLILGILTRPAALVIIVQMLMAVILAHAADVGKLNQGGGWMIELQALYAFGAMAIVFIGPGRWRIGRGDGPWA